MISFLDMCLTVSALNQNGGNLAFDGAALGSLTITRCKFESGSAVDGGGGAFITNSEQVAVQESLFESNNAGVSTVNMVLGGFNLS